MRAGRAGGRGTARRNAPAAVGRYRIRGVPAAAYGATLPRLGLRESRTMPGPFRCALAFLLALTKLAVPAAPAQGWVDVTPASPGLSAGVMCYDPVRAVSWLFTTNFSGQWTGSWNGATWSYGYVTPPWIGVSYSSLLDAIWDPVAQRVVVMYSNGAGGVSFTAWDGSTWASMPSLSVAPTSARIAYDVARSEVVLARPAGGVFFTYVFNGLSWIPKAPAVAPPSQGYYGSFFWDDAVGRLVWVTEVSSGLPLYWEWTGSNWVQRYPNPAHANLGNVATSLSRNIALAQLFPTAAPLLPRAFAIANGSFTELFLSHWPASRFNHSLVYDSGRDVFVLHGGQSLFSSGTPFTDTWELQLGPSASYSSFGAGCLGSAGIPHITPQLGSLPRVSSTFVLQVSQLPWTGPAFLWMGFSNQFYGSVPLPANLAALGAPQCNVLISPDILIAIPNVLGTSVWTLPLPPTAGLSLYNQAVVFDPPANPLGLVFSNAGYGVTGQ
jgi:hypothetical protein